MFTSFLTRKDRVRNAKAHKSQMILERLEDRQLLNGAPVQLNVTSAVALTFGQTLQQVAPQFGVDSHNQVVTGTHNYSSGVLNLDNQLFHAGTYIGITDTFTPSDSTDSPVSESCAVTVGKADWQITASSINTVYSSKATVLNGTFAYNDGSGQFVNFQDSPGVNSVVDNYLPVTYDVSGLGNQTHLINAISGATITPHVDGSAPEWDGTQLSHDINFSYVTGTANIDKASLNVVATSQTITYGNDGIAFVPAGTINKNHDNITATFAVSGPTSTSGNYTAGQHTITATINASADLLSNYDVVNTPGILTVNKLGLTVSATSDSKVYDGSTTAVAHLSDNRLFGDQFTDSYTSASFADQNAGTNKLVTVNGITINGTDASNYFMTNNQKTWLSFSSTDNSVSMSAGLNITYLGNGLFLAASGTLYGPGPNTAQVVAGGPGVATSASGQFYYDNVLSIDGSPIVDTVGGLLFSNGTTEFNFWAGDGNWNVPVGKYGFWSETSGAYAIQTSGNLSLFNFGATATASTTADISQKPLTITSSSSSKVYGTTDDLTLQFYVDGLVHDDQVLNVTRTSDGAASGADVGIYNVVLSNASGIGLSNYDIHYVNGILVVIKASSTITLTVPTDAIYNGSPQGATAEVTGAYLDQPVSTISYVNTNTNVVTPTAPTDAGSYMAVANFAGDANHTDAMARKLFTISPFTLTVTAASQNIVYGNAPATFSGTVSPDSNPDGVTFAYSTDSLNAFGYYNVGTHVITATPVLNGANQLNYNFQITSGNLVVAKASLVVAATPQYQVSYIGFANGENATTLNLPDVPTFTKNGQTITPVLSSADLALLVNYNAVYESATLPTSVAPPSNLGAVGAASGSSSASDSFFGWVGPPVDDSVFDFVTHTWKKKTNNIIGG